MFSKLSHIRLSAGVVVVVKLGLSQLKLFNTVILGDVLGYLGGFFK